MDPKKDENFRDICWYCKQRLINKPYCQNSQCTGIDVKEDK